MEFRPQFDKSVVNDDLERALGETEKIVEMFIKS